MVVIDHAYDHDLLRCRSKQLARVLPCRITLEYIAPSSLCAAGLTSFGPTAAKRLDDVRCPDATTNKELTLEQCSGVFDPEASWEAFMMARSLRYPHRCEIRKIAQQSPNSSWSVPRLAVACLTNLLITISSQG
ncbi:hypothetical protein [Bradyrhizobium sp. Rc2d]|uniref:hypothetical protein n=1 Tax=Bradyrhizobium sp. Rc2d TaxID=1855321 RepID=UPI001FCD2560|nr:hypothetical protein [Bradyrhizobium sp. Rc2d]